MARDRHRHLSRRPRRQRHRVALAASLRRTERRLRQHEVRLVVVVNGQALVVGEPDEPGLLHPHHFHRRSHDQILVRTIVVVVHRGYGHGSRAVLLACRNRQQRTGLSEVVRFGRRVRPRRHRHRDIGLDNRVQARGHRALATVFGDGGRGDRERYPGLGLILEDMPITDLENRAAVAGCRKVQSDSSEGARPVVLVVRGRKRDYTRAAHRPGGYGQRAVGAQREVVGCREVIRVRFVDVDRYRHVVGQRLAQVRDDRAGPTLDHFARYWRDRQYRVVEIVVEDVDLVAGDGHEWTVGGRASSQ